MGAEYEAKKAEYEAKKADREARQAAFQQRRAARAAANKWECESNCTESTAVTSGNEEVDEAEGEKLASMDKQVRKLAKTLREIANLEGLRDLDVLQEAKVARKREVEIELDTALGPAKARVRKELRGRRAA